MTHMKKSKTTRLGRTISDREKINTNENKREKIEEEEEKEYGRLGCSSIHMYCI
jgi:hypothetical protein